MASKRQQALYELMDGGSRPEPPNKPPARTPPPSPPRWFSAGRAIRVPVGYLLLGTGIGVMVVSAVFSLGYVRGRGDAQREFEQDWLAVNQTSLPVPPPEVAPRPAFPAESTDDAGEPTADEEPAAVVPAQPAGWSQIESEPRQAGLNYFILIHTRRANALKLAGFCRGHGVEAYAVQAKNGSLYRVVVLPGFAWGERSSNPVLALEQQITEVRRLWRLQVNPRDDLAYYPERFNG